MSASPGIDIELMDLPVHCGDDNDIRLIRHNRKSDGAGFEGDNSRWKKCN